MKEVSDNIFFNVKEIEALSIPSKTVLSNGYRYIISLLILVLHLFHCPVLEIVVKLHFFTIVIVHFQ